MDSRNTPVVGSVLLLIVALISTGCDGDDPVPADDAGVDGGTDADTHEGDSGDGDADTADADPDGAPDGSTSPWDNLDWHPIRDEGDATSDCEDGDAECAADIVQLSYAVSEGTLYLDLRFAGPFQSLEVGSFEIFVLPAEAGILGHSIRSVAHTFTFWDADCASVQKHSGCHWYSQFELPSFEYEWVDETRLVCHVDLDEWNYQNITEAMMGAAASPYVVQATADFTDRYPDDVWITGDEVRGLQAVDF